MQYAYGVLFILSVLLIPLYFICINKRKDIHNVISYSKEIEEYIIENLKANILYYDNYSKVIK